MDGYFLLLVAIGLLDSCTVTLGPLPEMLIVLFIDEFFCSFEDYAGLALLIVVLSVILMLGPAESFCLDEAEGTLVAGF